MKYLLHPVLASFSLLASMCLAMPAAAQNAEAAKTLFDRGLADMQAGRYEMGCARLSESLRLDRLPGTLFTLAVCESRSGRIATAAARYDEYLQLYRELPPEEQTRQAPRLQAAKEEREKLTPDIPLLTLSLSQNAPPGTVIKRNGEPVDQAKLGMALPVDPGEHVISTQVPAGPLSEQRITVGKGEKKQLTLELRLPAPLKVEPKPASHPPAAQATSTTPPSSGGQRTAAYVIGAAGIAGLAIGGITGGLALGKRGIIDEHCGSAVGSNDPYRCDVTGRDAAQSVGTLGLASTIGFVVGAAGVGTGVVLLLTAPKPQNPALGTVPKWIGAGVLSAGPQGAMLGAQGVW